MFLNFLNFFAIFFGIFLPGSSMNGIRDQNFSLYSSAYLILFWLKIMPKRGFLIFLLFFFQNFISRVDYERNSALKFFSLFLSLSHTSLYRNSVRMMFFNFLNFLAVFFGNGSPARVGTELGTKIFFSLSRLLSTHLDRNNAKLCFLIFWIFLLFFSEFSCSGRVWTKFGTRIFFSLSRPFPSLFG